MNSPHFPGFPVGTNPHGSVKIPQSMVHLGVQYNGAAPSYSNQQARQLRKAFRALLPYLAKRPAGQAGVVSDVQPQLAPSLAEANSLPSLSEALQFPSE